MGHKSHLNGPTTAVGRGTNYSLVDNRCCERMALFGRNFILLVEGGVTLPTNLQGLCECRYSGEELDMPATMTLFKAFNDFTRSRPTRPLTLAIGADHVVPEVMRYELGAPVYASN
jgi:hypothetical protein